MNLTIVVQNKKPSFLWHALIGVVSVCLVGKLKTKIETKNILLEQKSQQLISSFETGDSTMMKGVRLLLQMYFLCSDKAICHPFKPFSPNLALFPPSVLIFQPIPSPSSYIFICAITPFSLIHFYLPNIQQPIPIPMAMAPLTKRGTTTLVKNIFLAENTEIPSSCSPLISNNKTLK